MNKIARKLKRRQKKEGKRFKPSMLTNAISKTFKRLPMERRIIGERVRWYVLRTAVKGERIAKLKIEKAGFETFLPTYTEVVARKNRLTKQAVATDVERVLMPRYLFVAIPPSTPEAPQPDPREIVRNTDQVEAVLSFDGQPIMVPPRAIQRISDVLTGHGDEAAPIEIPVLVEGETMRVVDGPFASFSAVIEEVIATGRVKALVDIFGRATSVEFDLAQLERL